MTGNLINRRNRSSPTKTKTPAPSVQLNEMTGWLESSPGWRPKLSQAPQVLFADPWFPSRPIPCGSRFCHNMGEVLSSSCRCLTPDLLHPFFYLRHPFNILWGDGVVVQFELSHCLQRQYPILKCWFEFQLLCLWSGSCECTWESRGRRSKYLGTCHSSRKSSWNFRLMTLARSSAKPLQPLEG